MILSIKAGESGVITHNLSPGSIICKYSLRSIRTSTAPHMPHPHPTRPFPRYLQDDFWSFLSSMIPLI
jgi:hypothetical protein